jgi:dihydrofolate reductase
MLIRQALDAELADEMIITQAPVIPDMTAVSDTCAGGEM